MFVKRVETLTEQRSRGRDLDVVVTQAEVKDLVAWHERVQPIIRRDHPERIDSKWNWPLLYSTNRFLERAALRNGPLVLQLRTPLACDMALVLGQVMLVPKFTFMLARGAALSGTFIWYLAGAPERYLRMHGITERPLLLGPLIDTAVQLSKQAGNGGTVLLHAAASGGSADARERLLHKYSTIGMSQLRLDAQSISNLRRNDGRYFMLHETSVEWFSANYEHLRVAQGEFHG